MVAQILKGLWAALKPALPWILVAVLGGLVTYCTPRIGAGAQIQAHALALSTANNKAKRLQERADSLQSWLDFERSARTSDSAAAADAMTEERRSCTIRIDQARRASARIQELLKDETPHDPLVCPDRRLLDPKRLHDAITDSGAGSATGH